MSFGTHLAIYLIVAVQRRGESSEMKGSTVFLILGTLGVGVTLGEKLSPFGGNRVIATASVPDSSRVSQPFRQTPSPELIQQEPELIQQEEEAKIKKAETLLDDIAATDLEKNIGAVLGSDSLGQQVTRGLVAGRHQEIPGASEISQKFQAQLRADPKAGLDVVREGLRRIPEKGFEADRITLLQTAASLPGVENDARELALQELTSNVVETPAVSSLVAIAHRVFIDLTSDADQAYAGTLQGILSQPDVALRRSIIDKFIGKFPDRREGLQQELASRQIDPYSAGAQTEAPPQENEAVPAATAESGAFPAQPN